jgi:hypothetical protein
MANLFATKSLSVIRQEAAEEGDHTLKRSLGATNLITLGIGAIIGAGIFVLTGNGSGAVRGSGDRPVVCGCGHRLRLRGAVLRRVCLHDSHRG